MPFAAVTHLAAQSRLQFDQILLDFKSLLKILQLGLLLQEGLSYQLKLRLDGIEGKKGATTSEDIASLIHMIELHITYPCQYTVPIITSADFS